MSSAAGNKTGNANKYLSHLLDIRNRLDTCRRDVLPHVHREIMNQFVEEKTNGRLSQEMSETISKGMREITNAINNVDASSQRITDELAQMIELYAGAISMPTLNSKAMAEICEGREFLMIKKRSFDLVKFAMDPSGYIERFVPMSMDDMLLDHERWRAFMFFCVPPLIRYFIVIELATVISWNRAKGRFDEAFRNPLSAIKLHEGRENVTCADDYKELLELCVQMSSGGSKKRRCYLRHLVVICSRHHQSMIIDGLCKKQVKDISTFDFLELRSTMAVTSEMVD
ncbi:hypothetical protein FBU59_000826 [Linderina macrospora]|uniref:Uncharacterized protein n=1 Tax=Linderina macrospora TaxID=4868 RepID=A0ACC1JFK3_9FUNG|nr:hypothetical protein FBU59_000826 [Linderina macrospora]